MSDKPQEWRPATQDELMKIINQLEAERDNHKAARIEFEEMLHDVITERDRLREALEWYAEGNHVSESYLYDHNEDDERRVEIVCDHGERARKALELK